MTSNSRRHLIIVAGVNGAGKSSLTFSNPSLLAPLRILDPDLVAKIINPADYQGSALAAGRHVLQECQRLLGMEASFCVETTLSGHTYLRLMREALGQGYRVTLLYVGLDSVEISIQRVKLRVSLGGHDVAEQDLRRRYPRSLENLKAAFGLATDAALYDNSTTTGYQTVALKQNDRIEWLAPKPAWAASLAD
jgi:predicted ABC-type ATPase